MVGNSFDLALIIDYMYQLVPLVTYVNGRTNVMLQLCGCNQMDRNSRFLLTVYETQLVLIGILKQKSYGLLTTDEICWVMTFLLMN